MGIFNLYKLVNKINFLYKGVKYGRNLKVFNRMYITRPGKISIGDDFCFTSGDCINPICRNIRGCIHTGTHHSIITIGDHVGMSSPRIGIHKQLTIGNNVNISGNC